MNRTNRHAGRCLITAFVVSGLATAGQFDLPVRLFAAADWAKAREARNMRLVGHTDLNGIGDGGEEPPAA